MISKVTLDNSSRVNDRTILQNISQAEGDTLDIDRLAQDLGNVFALGVFEMVDYSLRESAAGSELVIQPAEKPYLPWLLHFGAAWQVFFQDQPQLKFLARLDRLELNRLGGEWRGDTPARDGAGSPGNGVRLQLLRAGHDLPAGRRALRAALRPLAEPDL